MQTFIENMIRMGFNRSIPLINNLLLIIADIKRNMRYHFSLILIFIVSTLRAQNFEYNIKLKSVTFSGDGMYQLRKDNNGNAISNVTHWTDDGIITPSAYTSGTYLKTSATFEFTCENAPSTIFIRGTGPDSISFPAIEVSIDSGFIQYPSAIALQPFEFHKVRYYESFSIHWEISFDNNHWSEAGTSASPVYVTWEEAIEESPEPWGSYKYFLSLVHIACKKANGATTIDEVIDSVWAEFTDHSVLNVNGEPLHYYQDILCQYLDIPSLLKYKDGSCFSWAQLFLGALKIHGFKQNNNYVGIDPGFLNTSCGVIDGFLAKDWTFYTPHGICTDLPYVNVWDNPSETDTSYLFQYEDAHDEIGVIGQTAANPASWFFNHQIVVVNDRFYDPSYGAVYETLEEVKEGDFSGWWHFDSGTEVTLGIDVNNDGDLDSDEYYIYNLMSPDLDLTTLDTYYETW